MSSGFQRLSLKDKAFSLFLAASDHELEDFYSWLSNIDAHLV